MKRLIIVTGLILVMLLVPVSCAKAPPVPAPAPSPPAPSTMPPPPVPATKGVLIEMHTKTTMAGVARHLTISVDGSIVFIEERGLRHPTKENPPTRTTRTGQLTEAELSNLLKLVDACLFDREGKRDARTEIIDTDAISELTVHYQKRTRIITANYQPLYHLSHPEIPELSDVHETVRKLYRELRYIIDSRTTQTAEEPIPQTNGGETHTPIPAREVPGSSVDPEAPDALMPAPGLGPKYRANIITPENPWPPIEISEAHLGSGSDNVSILFREYIKTAAGESRNNIIRATTSGKDINSLILYADDVPVGIKLTVGSEWSGPLSTSRSLLLVIEISPNVAPGQYPLEIGLEIDGKDYGTVPCTIKVLESVSAGTPSEPKEPYPCNHGITSTRATPEPGDNIYRSSSLMIRLTMDDLIEKSDVVVIGKVVDIFPARRVDIDGSSRDWIITTDAVIEVERYLYGQSRSPYIAVMVQGGRVEQTFVWVEDQPEFNLGEEVALFLNHPQLEITPPQGFEAADYYMVTGSMQGKFSYKDGYMVNLEGESFTVSEIERKIDLVHGGK